MPRMKKPSRPKPAVIADPGDDPDTKTLRHWFAVQIATRVVDVAGGWKICPRRECRRRRGCARPRGVCEWPRPPRPKLTPEESARAGQRLLRMLNKDRERRIAEGTWHEEPEPAQAPPAKRVRSGPAGPAQR